MTILGDPEPVRFDDRNNLVPDEVMKVRSTRERSGLNLPEERREAA